LCPVNRPKDQGVHDFFRDIHHQKSYKITTNQPTNRNRKKSQSSRIFLWKKIGFGSKIQKFLANFSTLKFQTVHVGTGSNAVQPSKIQESHTQEGAKEWVNPSLEACCMIDGWDLKHLWKRVRCPRCEDVFWKRYYKLYKRFSQNHANLTMTPTTVSSVAIYPHERDYVKSLCKNPGRALTSKCAKNDKNPHNCDCAL